MEYDGRRRVALADFLTDAQINQALAIWRKSITPAKRIADEVMAPNMNEINAKMGQENDPLFLAYMCEHVFNETQKRGRI